MRLLAAVLYPVLAFAAALASRPLDRRPGEKSIDWSSVPSSTYEVSHTACHGKSCRIQNSDGCSAAQYYDTVLHWTLLAPCNITSYSTNMQCWRGLWDLLTQPATHADSL